MCNAKPGTRCGSDTYKSLNIAVRNIKDRLAKNPSIIDTPRFALTLAELEDKKINFLAANSSIDDPKKALTEVRALTASLPDNVKQRLQSDAHLQVTAKYLHVFQAQTDMNRKQATNNGKPLSQRDSAYTMAQHDLPRIEKDIMVNMNMMHFQGNLSDEELNYHRLALNKATGVVSAESEGILAKDIKDNSRVWRDSLHPEEITRMTRNRDGSFTVNNVFSVKGKTEDEAYTEAEETFALEDVAIQLTPHKGAKGHYMAKTSYSVSFDDIEKVKTFHISVFQGTPRKRDALADIESVQQRRRNDS